MTKDREALLVAEVRKWLGTKWKHGQACVGAGTDCVQWLVVIGKKMGWFAPDYVPPVYNKDWALHNSKSVLMEETAKVCNRLQYEEKMDVLAMLQIGDVALFEHGKTASHAGIVVSSTTFIHSHIKHGVIETEIRDPYFLTYLDSVWRPKNG